MDFDGRWPFAGALSVESSAKEEKEEKNKKPAPIVRVERSETAEYAAAPIVAAADRQAASTCLPRGGCLSSRCNPTTDTSIEATDESGTPSPVKVMIGDAGAVYYGKTAESPRAVRGRRGGVTLGINVPNCQAVPTTDIVKTTFSKPALGRLIDRRVLPSCIPLQCVL